MHCMASIVSFFFSSAVFVNGSEWMELQVEKKVVGGPGFGDVYGVLMLPKETENPLLRFRLQLPDLRHALKVRVSLNTLLFAPSSVGFLLLPLTD